MCRLPDQQVKQKQMWIEAESDRDSLPDRVINPGEYEPVLSTTEKHKTAEHTENKEQVNEEPRSVTPVHTYGSIN